ncbi:MAG: PAS domain S-box protein [Candidatus Heimdallarchaeota archaeon]|nr:MAG: PAS domain S-box protein [Candidatus Heimdallarchaeota archaeon]
MTLNSLLLRDDIPDDVIREIKLAITDQRKIEENSLKTETRLQFLLKSSPAVIFSCEPRDNFPTTFMSENVKEILGHDVHEFISNPSFWTNGIHPDDRQHSVEIFQGIVQSEHYSVTYRFKHKNGSYLWMMDEATLIRDNQGNPIEIVGYWTDITKQKEAEERLRKSEEDYRSLFENIPIGLYRSTPDHEFVAANPTFIKQVGLSSFEELALIEPNKLATRRNYPRDRFLKEIHTKGEVKGLEFELKKSDGTSIYIRENARAIKDSKGTIRYYEGSVEDITDRVLMEEALRESETKYRTLVERANDGIAIVQGGKLGDKFLFINQRFAQMLGYRPDELLNMSYAQVVHPDAFPEINERRKARLAGNEVSLTYDSKLIKKNGNSLEVGLNLGIIDYQGEEAVLAIVRDITKRKQAEEQLQYQANLLTYVSDAVIASDLDFRITSWNKAAEKIYGWQEEEVLGKEVGILLHQEFPYHIRDDVLGDFMREGIWQGEVIQKRKDGTPINILMSVALVKDRTGKPIAALAVNRDITERKQAEQAIKENKEKYRSFIENFQGIAFEGYADYTQDFFLGNVEEITGYTETDFLSGRIMFKELIHPEDAQRITNDVVKFYSSSKELTRREYRIFDRYGTIHWLQEDIKKFYNKEKDKIGVYGTIQDITKRKQAEEALRENEEKYRSLVELANDGIVIIRDMKFNFLNRQAVEMLGYTVEELIDVPFAKVVHPDGFNDALKMYQDRMAGHDVPSKYEMKLSRKDGTPLDVEINVRMITYQDGTAELAMARDITERKKAEIALRESEERLRKFMESATDGFTLLDLNLNFIDINKAGLIGLNLAEEEVVGKNFLEIFPKLKDSSTYDNYLEVLKTGKPYYSDDIDSAPRIRNKYYSVRAFKVGDGLGIITTDITDRVKAEKTREELEQRRDSFVWMTSHELRTPLTVLTGYCDFLIEHINDLAQQRITNILSVMKNNLDRLERLTSKVSTIGQIERGIFEIEKTSMNLCDFLQNTLEPYHQLLGNQFEFQGCLEESAIIIDGDPHRLQQVLDNIIGNAIKQTDKDSRRISVTSKIFPLEIKIEVSDNGAGIRSEDLNLIFDQFVSIPTEFSATGTGIGLYLCRKTLEAHGGKITAESKGPGLGATFIIELPRKSNFK